MFDIFSELKKYNLPLDELIVVGSGILSAKGIRDIGHDLDLVVSDNLFQILKKDIENWDYEVVEFDQRKRERLCTKDKTIEAFKDFFETADAPLETFADFKNESDAIEVINGVAYISLKKLRGIKELWARDKDLVDLRLIDEFLNNN